MSASSWRALWRAVSAEHNLKLRAARQDPRLMADLVLQALLGLLRGECSRAPLVLVLEDLQWCDSLTVKVLGAALTQLLDAPLCVLALARPELHATFPHLWRGLVQVIPCDRCRAKAAERLVQQFLGQAASLTLKSRIVEQADGNPLWLEELIRSAASGAAGEAPLGFWPCCRRASASFQRICDSFCERPVSLASRLAWAASPRCCSVTRRRRAGGAGQGPGGARDPAYLGEQSLRRADRAALSPLADARCGLQLAHGGRSRAGAPAGLPVLREQGETEAALLAEHARRGNDLPRAALHYSAAAEEHSLATM